MVGRCRIDARLATANRPPAGPRAVDHAQPTATSASGFQRGAYQGDGKLREGAKDWPAPGRITNLTPSSSVRHLSFGGISTRR
jgi:hypothetical protein